jgi:catechol 2,3-dioxygenase-like lactoylglutathione lyase family enzyme
MTIDRRQTLLFAPTLFALAASPGAGGAETAAAPARERVLGIGGFFFRGKDPAALAKWYQDHLGIDPIPTDYGHKSWRQAAGPTAFAPFPSDTHYIGPPEHQWMLNFRVRNLAAITAQLMAEGIAVKVDPTAYPNGRFARLHDPEGNAIELWEPADPADRAPG